MKGTILGEPNYGKRLMRPRDRVMRFLTYRWKREPYHQPQLCEFWWSVGWEWRSLMSKGINGKRVA